MLNIIAFAIIVSSLAVISVIIGRKFPQLANLEVHHLPAEREARKKRELLTRRMEERARRMQKSWALRLRPLLKGWGKVQLKFRIYVGKMERLWHHEQMQKKKLAQSELPPQELADRLGVLLKQGDEKLLAGEYEPAEQLFIQAISLDQRSVAAYRGLAGTYGAKGAWQEAVETYHFVLRLTPKDDAIMAKLAEIEVEQCRVEQAIGWYQQAVSINDAFSPYFFRLAELLLQVRQPLIAREAIVPAVELEPKNPKYLDLLTEVAIQCRDKELATQAWGDLRLVNPQNQKLDSLKARIADL